MQNGRNVSGVRSYKDLEVWKAAVELTVQIYDATRGFPKDEMYGLTSQIRRAAISITANIAEGHTRQHTGEFIQFVSIARASGAEVETLALIARRLGYLSPESESQIQAALAAISRMLQALQSSLRKKP